MHASILLKYGCTRKGCRSWANFGDDVNPMGLFCSVTMPVKCPYCGTVETRECQTKEFGRSYRRWKIGDFVWLADDPDGELEFDAWCEQPSCRESRPLQDGRIVGDPRRFLVVVELVNGIITGEYLVFKEEECNESD